MIMQQRAGTPPDGARLANRVYLAVLAHVENGWCWRTSIVAGRARLGISALRAGLATLVQDGRIVLHGYTEHGPIIGLPDGRMTGFYQGGIAA